LAAQIGARPDRAAIFTQVLDFPHTACELELGDCGPRVGLVWPSTLM
jgi:hypothetical protein